MDNNAILAEKTKPFRESWVENYALDGDEAVELTVTITLEEYRKLIRENALSDKAQCELRVDNATLRDEKKKAAAQIADLQAQILDLQKQNQKLTIQIQTLTDAPTLNVNATVKSV